MNKTVALHYPWFKKEDINGFITLFQDNLSNFVILSISMLSMGFPASIVFGKVVPGAVIALAAGNFYHAYMANRLAKKENRTNVTPLSYGVSTGGMFIYLFGVLLPVKTLVGDPEVAWKIAVASCFFIGFLEVLVSFAGRWLKANVPRAAMLGTISGLALAVIGGEMVFGMLEVPLVGLVVFGIIFAGLLGKAVMPLKIPTTLFALILGTVLAYALGHANISELKEGLNQLGFYPFIPTIAAFEGMGMLFTTASFVIALVIPVKLYHAMETITNVESIEVLGDKYDVRECMIVDGSCTMLGTLFGGVFPTMVYLGSPAYKAMNAGRGFVILNGIAYLIAGMFGIIALISATIPLPAIAPILVFVALMFVTTAFESSDKKYYPAVTIAMIPYLANFIVNNFGAEAANELSTGVVPLSQGPLFSGIILGSIVVSIIDMNYKRAAAFSFTGAVLSFVGLMHASELGFNAAPTFSLGFLALGLVFIYFAFTMVKVTPKRQLDQPKVDESLTP